MRVLAEPTRRARLLHLFALSGFALLQPVLDLLGRDPGFLVARHASPIEIVSMVVVLALVPPLVLFALVEAARLCSRRLGDGLALLFVAELSILIVLPPLNRSEALNGGLTLALVASIGGVAALAYAKAQVVRAFLAVLSVAPLLFAALFFAREDISALVFPDRPNAEASVPVESDIPLVFVIFDELPLYSLLDEEGAVDSARYPAFARLDAISHGFRNATANDWRTLQVLPAILTGRWPAMRRRPPIWSEHPRNLFSLLAPHYRMHVVESHTQLDEAGEIRGATGERAISTFEDLGLVYLHLVVPEEFADGLPSVSQTWKDFGASHRDDESGDRAAEFRDFVRAIDSDTRASLHFIHLMLPHSPWQYTRMGERYAPGTSKGTAFGTWLEEEWWALQAQQRHLIQLEFVDRLLGELLDRLESIGRLDETLLVVTADHGVSFWPEGTYRDVGGALHPEDILVVPLFIKEPGQRSGSMTNRNVESIDIFPTILDRMGIEVPWQMDGCSAFAPGCTERSEKVVFSTVEYSSEENRRIAQEPDLGERRASLERKIALFGTGASPGGLYRFGPHADLIGAETAAMLAGGREGTLPVGRLRLSEGVPRERVPHRVHGSLELDDARELAGPPMVVVSVAGRIQVVVPAVSDGGNALRRMMKRPLRTEIWVTAMLPESGPAESWQVHLLLGSGDARRLRPIAID